MDFITGIPKRTKQHDAIMVALDNFSKESHLTSVNSTHKIIDIDQILIKEIFILHVIPNKIISYWDAKFTSNFWKENLLVLESK